MRLLLFLILTIFSFSARSQISPATFAGHWEGTLCWYRYGHAEPRLSKMQLIVQPTDTAGMYTWQLIYGEGNKDLRPYIIRALDSVKGHWVIDEKNSILLDQYIVGNRLCGTFTVGEYRINNCYWLEKDELVVEFMTTSVKPVTTSGGTSEDIPKVESFAVHGYQRAILKRRK